MVRIPLAHTRLRQTGETAVIPRISLPVRAASGEFASLEFVVDTGANFTSVPVAEANRLGITVPARVVTLEVRTAVSTVNQRVHPGHIQVQVPGLDGHTFRWPCHFVEHGQGVDPTSMLGLSGILNDLRLTFDGTYSLDARYGVLLLEPVASSQP